MSSDWIDDLLGGNKDIDDDASESLYCPYTNTEVCALIRNGWQPQELCEVLECSQLKLFRGNRYGHKAA